MELSVVAEEPEDIITVHEPEDQLQRQIEYCMSQINWNQVADELNARDSMSLVKTVMMPIAPEDFDHFVREMKRSERLERRRRWGIEEEVDKPKSKGCFGFF